MSPPDPPNDIFQMKDLQRCISEYSVEDMEQLLAWLKSTIKTRKQEVKAQKQTKQKLSIPLKEGREIVETLNADTVTYRLEMVKCGKKKCKCNKGKLHGPYWYAYRWNGKKLTSQYVGKSLVEPLQSPEP